MIYYKLELSQQLIYAWYWQDQERNQLQTPFSHRSLGLPWLEEKNKYHSITLPSTLKEYELLENTLADSLVEINQSCVWSLNKNVKPTAW